MTGLAASVSCAPTPAPSPQFPFTVLPPKGTSFRQPYVGFPTPKGIFWNFHLDPSLLMCFELFQRFVGFSKDLPSSRTWFLDPHTPARSTRVRTPPALTSRVLTTTLDHHSTNMAMVSTASQANTTTTKDETVVNTSRFLDFSEEWRKIVPEMTNSSLPNILKRKPNRSKASALHFYDAN